MENYFISFGLGVVKFFVPSLRPIVMEIRHYLLPIVFSEDPRDHPPSHLLLVSHIFMGKCLQQHGFFF